jgi:methylenetetrahydrofolate reductase (NADPH)
VPDDVVRGLQSASDKTKASIAGFHLFPFGGLRKAGEWRRNYRREAPPQTERAAPISDYEKP